MPGKKVVSKRQHSVPSHEKNGGILAPVKKRTARSDAAMPRIFINYRRRDSKDAAAYLKALLARRFGAEKIFRDIDSIPVGADFPVLIQSTIASAVVFITLIGKNWLAIKDASGKPRLYNEKDYVRMELEAAFRLGKPVIPVLLNGAAMPAEKELPPSIAKLATLNAVELSWFEGLSKLGREIAAIEKNIIRDKNEAAAQARKLDLDISAGAFTQRAPAGRNVILTAMEFSLARQGNKVVLDDKDFSATLERFSDKALKGTGAFFFEDMVYIVDCVGVKRRNSTKRYIARTFPLTSLSDLPVQLGLNRPVICSFYINDDWFDKKTAATGIIDFIKPLGSYSGSTVGIIIGWDDKGIKLQTPWPGWGNKGVATLSRAAVQQHIELRYLRSVEAVEMPQPFSASYLTAKPKPGSTK